MDTIMRHEILPIIDSGATFDMVFTTADRRRGTGGINKTVKGWKKITNDASNLVRVPGQFIKREKGVSRNPNHATHKTFNIYNPNRPSEHALSVHWRLVHFFNGKRVIQ